MHLVFKQLLIMVCILSLSIASAQIKPGKLDMDAELKYRSDKVFKEEKYYKNDKLDSVYRKWNNEGQKLTEGYYINGKKHGDWYEWLSEYQKHDYLLYTYDYGVLRKLYKYSGWKGKQDSIKGWEHLYIFEPGDFNYSQHYIHWNTKCSRKKNEDTFTLVRNGLVVKRVKKVWENGIPWKEEEERMTFDSSGKKQGLKKHGHWKLWNEDGTLQKETWHNMGKKLREKLYDHGKLISDKKY